MYANNHGYVKNAALDVVASVKYYALAALLGATISGIAPLFIPSAPVDKAPDADQKIPTIKENEIPNSRLDLPKSAEEEIINPSTSDNSTTDSGQSRDVTTNRDRVPTYTEAKGNIFVPMTLSWHGITFSDAILDFLSGGRTHYVRVAGLQPQPGEMLRRLEPGDLIQSVNGVSADSIDQLNSLILYQIKTGQTVKLEVLRPTTNQLFRIDIDDNTSVNPVFPTFVVQYPGKSPLNGASFATRTNDTGLVVTDVEKNSPSDRAGLKEGDMLVSINDVAVSSPASLSKAMLSNTSSWVIKIERNGQFLTSIFGDPK